MCGLYPHPRSLDAVKQLTVSILTEPERNLPMAFKPSAALSLLLLVVVLATVHMAAGRKPDSKKWSSKESSSKRDSKSQEQDWCSSDCQGSLLDLETKIDQLQAGQDSSQSNTAAQLTAMNSDIQEILKRARCPASFVYDSNINLCIQLFTFERVTWDDATTHCSIQGSGGRLAVLDTQEKATFAGLMIKSIGEWVWLGGQRQDGEFKWTTGQAVGLEDMWRENYPTPTGDCLFIGSNQLLGNIPCGNKRSFLCDVPL